MNKKKKHLLAGVLFAHASRFSHTILSLYNVLLKRLGLAVDSGASPLAMHISCAQLNLNGGNKCV